MATTPKKEFITLDCGKDSYGVDSLSLSQDGKTLAAAGWFGGSELYAFKIPATASKKPTAIKVKKPRDAFRHIALSQDGSVLFGATRTFITRMCVQGKGAGKPLAPLGSFDKDNDSHEDEVVALTLRPNDGAVLAAAVGDALVLFDAKSGEEIETRRGSPLSTCKFSSDGKALVGINRKGAVVILDGETMKRIAIVELGDTGLCHLAVAGDLIALASFNPKTPIRLFSLSKRKLLSTLEQHTSGGIANVTLSRDAKRLASAGEDGHVRVWDVAKKKLLADVHGEQEAMGDVVFLDDGGKRVAAGGRDVQHGPPVYVWNID